VPTPVSSPTRRTAKPSKKSAAKAAANYRVKRSVIHGRGVFAERELRRSDWIGTFEGVPTTRDGTHVLWTFEEDGTEHGVRGTSGLRFLNHSSRPNAEFRDLELHALRRIRVEEEITIHYGDAWEDVD
jgi:SET domain-containing protein